MAKRYDPIMCMLVDEPTKAQDELSLAQKKQVVTELKGYLKKSYNFSDESEYARAYEDLRHMFTTGSRKSISGLFENAVKKTGAHDSASALDKAIKTCDAASGDAMKQISNIAKAWAKQYNQLFEKATTAEEVKKLKSQKDNDYHRAMDNLDKIYNEVSQAYGRARSEVRDLFDEVDSNGFKAYQRVTQK